MTELPKAAVIRLMKSRGAERISDDAVTHLARAAGLYISAIAQKSCTLAEHSGRKTIKSEDVDLALSDVYFPSAADMIEIKKEMKPAAKTADKSSAKKCAVKGAKAADKNTAAKKTARKSAGKASKKD